MVNQTRTGKILDKFFQIKSMMLSAGFALCLAIGYWALNTEDQKINYEGVQLSSIAKNLNEVSSAEFASINRLSIKKNQQQDVKQLPKRFKDNPAFKFFVYLEEIANKTSGADHIERKIAEDSGLN